MQTTEPLLQRIRDLEARLAESEETLDAIKRGEIDAVVVADAHGEQHVYTLESADRPYRVLIEQMQEAAVTLGADGTVIYCSRGLATLLDIPHEHLIGRSLQPFLLPGDEPGFQALLTEAKQSGIRQEMTV